MSHESFFLASLHEVMQFAGTGCVQGVACKRKPEGFTVPFLCRETWFLPERDSSRFEAWCSHPLTGILTARLTHLPRRLKESLP